MTVPDLPREKAAWGEKRSTVTEFAERMLFKTAVTIHAVNVAPAECKPGPSGPPPSTRHQTCGVRGSYPSLSPGEGMDAARQASAADVSRRREPSPVVQPAAEEAGKLKEGGGESDAR